MLSDTKTNKQIMLSLYGLMGTVQLRIKAFETISKVIEDPEMRELLEDLIIYDIRTVLDDIGTVFPFR